MSESSTPDPKKNHTPSFKVTVGGSVFEQGQPKGVTYVSVEDHLDMLGVATITLNGGTETDWSKIKVNDPVEIKVDKSSAPAFKGFVSKMEPGAQAGVPTLTLQCFDPLVKMAASRVTKTYEQQTDSDIVKAVIGRAGLTVGKVDATTETNLYVLQRNESDLNFCKRLASRNGYILYATEGKVNFIKPSTTGAAVTVKFAELTGYKMDQNPISIPKKLTVVGWDYVKKEKVEGSAGPGDIEPIGSGKNSVAGNGDIWAGESYVSDVLVSSQGAAKAMAVGELNRIARGFIKGRASVQGRMDIRAGVKLSITEMFTGTNPEVLVVSARHVIEPSRGFTTEFQFCANTWPK